MGDTHVGLQARLMSQALKTQLEAYLNQTQWLFLNQIRMKIGVMFEDPDNSWRKCAQILFFCKNGYKTYWCYKRERRNNWQPNKS